MTIRSKQIFVDTSSLFFATLFIYAALSKWLNFRKFRVETGQSPILTHFAGWIVGTVPPVELLIAALILHPRGRRTGLYAAFSLMTIFSGYIVLIKWFSPFTPCSCGGILQHMSWNQHLVFNIFCIMLAVLGILIESKIPLNPNHLLQ